MKKHAMKSVPLGSAFRDGGAETFIHGGVDGRWADVLDDDDIARYDKRAVDELGEDCAYWLKTGRYRQPDRG